MVLDRLKKKIKISYSKHTTFWNTVSVFLMLFALVNYKNIQGIIFPVFGQSITGTFLGYGTGIFLMVVAIVLIVIPEPVTTGAGLFLLLILLLMGGFVFSITTLIKIVKDSNLFPIMAVVILLFIFSRMIKRK